MNSRANSTSKDKGQMNGRFAGKVVLVAGGTGGLGRAVSLPSADFAKWPKPEEIARVILFLCSDDAKVIHGAAVPVYGNT